MRYRKYTGGWIEELRKRFTDELGDGGRVQVIVLWLVMMQNLDLILNILGSHWVVFVLWYDIHNEIYHCKCTV